MIALAGCIRPDAGESEDSKTNDKKLRVLVDGPGTGGMHEVALEDVSDVVLSGNETEFSCRIVEFDGPNAAQN